MQKLTNLQKLEFDMQATFKWETLPPFKWETLPPFRKILLKRDNNHFHFLKIYEERKTSIYFCDNWIHVDLNKFAVNI